jgi:putative endonuclease
MSTATGYRAEASACDYLEACGFMIVERNYRTPRYEIDVIARKKDRVYFVEVKVSSPLRARRGIRICNCH